MYIHWLSFCRFAGCAAAAECILRRRYNWFFIDDWSAVCTVLPGSAWALLNPRPDTNSQQQQQQHCFDLCPARGITGVLCAAAPSNHGDTNDVDAWRRVKPFWQ